MIAKAILGRAFIEILFEAGIVPERTAHVVIDAPVGGVARIHYTLIGDDRLLSVVAPAAIAAAVVDESLDESS